MSKFIKLTHAKSGKEILIHIDNFDEVGTSVDGNGSYIARNDQHDSYFVKESIEEIRALIEAPHEPAMIHDDWCCPWYAESQKWRIVEPKLKALMAEIHNYKTDDCVPPQIEEAYDELVSALDEKASNP